jgi:hypothetical protein
MVAGVSSMGAALTTARASAALALAHRAPTEQEKTMAEYQVKRTRKDRNGRIVALCGDGWTKSTAEVAREINLLTIA